MSWRVSWRQRADAGTEGVVVDLADAVTGGSVLLTSLRDSAESLRARGAALMVVCGSPSLAGFLRLMLFDRAYAVVGARDEVRPWYDRRAS